MKKIVINLVILVVILFITLIATLSTVGIETKNFNKVIVDKASQKKNINLKLETIRFKINLKQFDLFLETQNPEIKFREVSIPVQNIKVYVNFLSLLKSEFKIKKTILVLEELDITQLNQLSIMIKPSNFKSLLNNKIKKGKLITEIEIFLTEQGTFQDFIARGTIKGLKIELFSGLNLKNTELKFFADKNDILIKNIFGKLEDIEISDGDIKLNLENGIKINSNFNSKLNLDDKLLNKYSKFLQKYKFLNNVKTLKADLNNNFFVFLDNTYKVEDYNYSINGNIENTKFELSNPIKNSFITEEIKKIYLSDFKISSIINHKNINFKGDGKYSFNNLDFLNINLENNLQKNLLNLKLNFDYNKSFQVDIINYKKSKKSIANFSLDLEKTKQNIKINKLVFKEKDNSISINELGLRQNKLSFFKKIKVETTNNNFFILNDKKILIKGNKFDATNINKFFVNQADENKFQNLNSNIEINFKNINLPMSEQLKDFKLLGEIKRGQFVKISSKGDFGDNNFLDISMKIDKNANKKYLEIYSDLTRPIISEYKFFKGLSGGKLLFSSIINSKKSKSKLKIENFKIVNAPGVVKLLSLADLGGLADLVEGEGLSFDILEIDMEKNKNFLKINELLALGPSMSVLMEGYQEENGLTSLRGTLVPAKTLNKMISKIPVIGNIVIPKEVGEGLFGISFKMKGNKDNIKTTINPIRTITPRFIQKIIERNKESK
tara:strand:+ start:216 stop:2387 length:2172 start_codon:yes stop_codon:yes gene_type:complete